MTQILGELIGGLTRDLNIWRAAMSESHLILSRRVGETVCIGDDITVTVLGVKGNQVRLLFDAPKKVNIHRKEVYERIQREQEACA